MPPKFKFEKEEIINTAINLVRQNGADYLTARNLGSALGSSAKPIFSLFGSMDEVKKEVFAAAYNLYESYLETDIKKGEVPPYKASGLAYIRFANEEKELFKLLFMRDRTGEDLSRDQDRIKPIIEIIMENLKVDEETAVMLHLKLWVYVHGVATMCATRYLNWDTEFISTSISEVYNGLILNIKE